MSKETCILTTKDFTVLEAMRNRCASREDPLAAILTRKLDGVQVVFREDLPANIASVNSRITYVVNTGDSDTRVLSLERMVAPVGMFLPITTLRGLALLGLAEGQEFVLRTDQGVRETILLEKVHYQPEAARREKTAGADPSARPVRRQRPVLKLVRGGAHDKARDLRAVPDGHDDPGPSVA
ncbi:nucleoside-diphosphate kinase [Labrenzia sp. 011]|uniref:nucleoside-diphosphate kinase n=1 Tax=Labrenzia sp. 011 TaxID=2171494 RepID=UPI000D51789C|nr:nucleoside-diphosphate kinase [Labrenzia sp. 011]PVB63296.1 nucleoside-diphosphate kinase [Labrenzia sp. 011]